MAKDRCESVVLLPTERENQGYGSLKKPTPKGEKLPRKGRRRRIKRLSPIRMDLQPEDQLSIQGARTVRKDFVFGNE